MTPKLLPLHPLHLELGAKMAPFAGYSMPLHYGPGIIQEHLHCRLSAGFFDISHMGQFYIDGDVAAELENLTPSDITGLKPGFQKYTVLTLDNGGVLDDIIVSRAEGGFGIVVNAACKDKDFAYLQQHLPGLKALQERALFALQGPQAAAILSKYVPETAGWRFMQSGPVCIDGIDCTLSRSGYTGEDGFEMSVAVAEAERLARLLLSEPGVLPIGLGARDTLRLEAGLSLYGHELDDQTTPVEAGLSWIVKKNHDRFPGAHKILAQLRDGAPTVRAGLLAEGKAPVREGAVLTNAAGETVGRVTSGGFSPSLSRPIALARIEAAYIALGTHLYAEVRSRQIAMEVVPLPFVPHRYRR